MSAENYKAGIVALVGNPNVGKSSLVNALVGKHLCAVSSKPQTTRNRVTGIANSDEPTAGQIVFVDTPGLQSGGSALRRFMRQESESAVLGCDLIAVVIDAGLGADITKQLGELPMPEAQTQKLLIINKIDKLKDKKQLLPMMVQASDSGWPSPVPVSAKTGQGLAELSAALLEYLPVSEPLFPKDMSTDRDETFLAAELIREQVYLQTGEEIPYQSAVKIERWEDFDNGDVKIHAAILLERSSQKAIVIGARGARIKTIGAEAREK